MHNEPPSHEYYQFASFLQDLENRRRYYENNPHLLPGFTPQLQNLFNLSPNLLNIPLHPSPSIILLILWICLLPAGTLHPVETAGNASIVAPGTIWFETACSLITVLWGFAQPRVSLAAP